jgi:hypothetical protein
MRRILAALCGAVAAAAVVAAPAAANHSWGGYHWARTANPFTVTLGDNVSSTWDSYLRTAASDWSANTGGNPLNAAVGTGASNPRNCRPTSGRVEVCNSTYGQTGWLGVAQIWARGTHITQGTVKVNDTYHNSPPYNTAVWRAHVMCQEVGHTFGLGHQDESGADFHTCMDYVRNPDADNTHPNAHDYEQLALIYAHLDTTTTIGRAGGASARPYRVERTDRPSRSTIVERFSDGSKRITFIFWKNPS